MQWFAFSLMEVLLVFRNFSAALQLHQTCIHAESMHQTLSVYQAPRDAGNKKVKTLLVLQPWLCAATVRADYSADGRAVNPTVYTMCSGRGRISHPVLRAVSLLPMQEMKKQTSLRSLSKWQLRP